MNRAIKHFVKKVACFPDRIIRNDFENIGVDLRPEEKCHVALLAAEGDRAGQSKVRHLQQALAVQQNVGGLLCCQKTSDLFFSKEWLLVVVCLVVVVVVGTFMSLWSTSPVCMYLRAFSSW